MFEGSLFPFFRTLLTTRGWILLIVVAYLLIIVVPEESDIVAAVFGYSIVGLFVLGLGLTIAGGRGVKRNLHVQLGAHAPGPESYEGKAVDQSGRGVLRSGESTVVMVKTQPVKLPPLFALELELVFEHPGLHPARHIITGRSDEPRILIDELSFPHRGEWAIAAIRCSFGDYLGLFSYRWEVAGAELQGCFRVHPPFFNSTVLPVLSSAVRTGDAMVDMQDRRGDPFDLKPYHPSDGLRKILWKLYAKRGELISRHPERAMTPEGKVVIFACAGQEDDELCGHLLAYMQHLESLDLEIFFGCEGMGQDAPARTAQSAEDLLIETAWNVASSGGGQELEKTIDTVLSYAQDSQLRNVLVFCSEQRFATREVRDFIMQVGESLQRRGIQPVFCVHQGASRWAQQATVPTLAARILAAMLDPLPGAQMQYPKYYRNFAAACAAKGWEMYNAS